MVIPGWPTYHNQKPEDQLFGSMVPFGRHEHDLPFVQAMGPHGWVPRLGLGIGILQTSRHLGDCPAGLLSGTLEGSC